MSGAGTAGWAVSFDDVVEARERIAPFIHRTPVVTSRRLDERIGRSLHFKCENLQRVGAFKMRGAANAVFALTSASAERGVVTHSSGNFGQAMALAAQLRGTPAYVVMPTTAPRPKREAIAGYGAEVIPCAPTIADRERTAEAVLARTGGTLLHPFDQPQIIAGQGTCAVELLEDVPDLDAIIAPIGGGGLVAGICIAARAVRPACRILAGEPSAADDAARSLASGERQPPPEAPRTIADGLLTGLGELTWPIVRDHVERIITVSDEQIIDAMKLVWHTLKLVIEPSAAVAVAALRRPAFQSIEGIERVGVVLSGGNVDLDRLPWR